MKSKEIELVQRAVRKALKPYINYSMGTVANTSKYILAIAESIKETLESSETLYTEDSLWNKELNFTKGFRPHCISSIVEGGYFKELTFEFLEPEDVKRFKTVFGVMMVDSDKPQKLWRNMKIENGDGVTRIHIRR